MSNIISTLPANPAQRPLLIAFGGVTALFALLLTFGFPVYHSPDDTFTAMILGNGFGTGQSDCLPFMHNMHYWLSAPLIGLYKNYPSQNWYSWLLLFTQYICCIVIFYVQLKRQNWLPAVIFFLLSFSVYVSFLILYLHNSSAAVTAIAAGSLLIWHYADQPKGSKWLLIPAAALLVLGMLLRLHIAIPLLIIAAPFFLLIKGWKKKLEAVAVIAICILLALNAYTLHENYYTRHCPNWQSEEHYRQAKYDFINYNRDTTKASLAAYREDISLVNALILPDTAFIPRERLSMLAREAKTIMPLRTFFSMDTLYWPLVNNRLFLVMALVAMSLFWGRRQNNIIKILSLLAAAALTVYLVMVMKLPEFIIPSFVFTWFVFAASSVKYIYPPAVMNRVITFLIIASFIGWGVVRAVKISNHNKEEFGELWAIQRELSTHPDKLFISIGDNDVFGSFYVFATPEDYPMKNMLFVDQPLSLRNAALLRDFGYTGFNDAILNPNVYFRGPELPALTDHFTHQLQKPVDWGGPLSGFKYSRVCKPMTR
ncbi:hypothetical protein HHL16_09590 [Pseudoflavitalea sp. G-6-1-2]|uniref:hypothetical protein n=1 Tax=Pseudoflavitalea sp. G-6-1-2 TaxID=2728841 RepID=UPI00146DB651|nr:hypothetical protein [Pseudoflavitalea sp. G-6-1-2]NML21126.1 hypothetical protein [Pseudoflavitalea sp. G-6-1-2]